MRPSPTATSRVARCVKVESMLATACTKVVPTMSASGMKAKVPSPSVASPSSRLESSL
jgi:hypothetical protein